MTKKKLLKAVSKGPDRKMVKLAYEKGVKSYIATRRRKLPGFIRKHFGWNGSFRRHREAFGWDLVKAPLNLFWSPILLGALLLETVSGIIGWKEAEAFFRNRWPGFTTAVEQEMERLVYIELLELPLPGDEIDTDEVKNVLFETILTQPEIGEWIEETISIIKAQASTATYQKNIKAALKELDKDHRFAVKLLTENQLIKGGGAIEIGTAIATTMAQQSAINSFWAGPAIGKIWFGTFATASASLGATLGCITGVAVILALVSAVAGMVADPILKSIGSQKRRLAKTLNALERELNGTSDGTQKTPEVFIESLVGLVQYINNVADVVGVIVNNESEPEGSK
jgi:hypothetical protein